jgi:hypothetical protein
MILLLEKTPKSVAERLLKNTQRRPKLNRFTCLIADGTEGSRQIGRGAAIRFTRFIIGRTEGSRQSDRGSGRCLTTELIAGSAEGSRQRTRIFCGDSHAVKAEQSGEIERHT